MYLRLLVGWVLIDEEEKLESIDSLRIPWPVPYLICAGIAFFVTAHTSPGAAVLIDFHVDGRRVVGPTVYDFTLGNSVRQMFKAEAYALAILIAVFSGAWAYLKMVLMLVWVLVPFRALSINTRYVSSDRLSAMAWQ